MNRIKSFLSENDQFAKHSGIELMEVSTGYAKAKMIIMDYHLNGIKTVHGGAVFTLADFAFAAASNSHGRVAVGISATVSYIKAVRTGVLFAEARELSINHKMGNYIINIMDDQNDLVAVFQGTAYRKKEEY